MITKKIFSCLLAVALISTVSSFDLNKANRVNKEKTFYTANLHQFYNVGGSYYYLYVEYDTVSGTVTGATVFDSNCNSCTVNSITVAPSTTFTNTGRFNWTISGSVTVSTSCGTFILTGAVADALPFC
jgi:hypothetical protein